VAAHVAIFQAQTVDPDAEDRRQQTGSPRGIKKPGAVLDNGPGRKSVIAAPTMQKIDVSGEKASSRVNVAALFVERDGAYFGLPNVEPWDVERDARLYAGPHPVVAHPPCERWGRYWSGGPSAKVRRKLGDDEGCFESALRSVKRWGGVLEHPEGSHAFERFHITRPSWREGWKWCPSHAGFVCCVAQGNYGHRARKLTWLFYSGWWSPFALDWSIPAPRARLDVGFHSKAEREAKKQTIAPQVNASRLSTKENLATPTAFRDALLRLAERSAT
jgi:hypothetical protein